MQRRRVTLNAQYAARSGAVELRISAAGRGHMWKGLLSRDVTDGCLFSGV